MIKRFERSRPYILATLLLLSATNALAQVSTGAIAGTVKDSSGALSAGVTVTITNTATGIITTSVTSSTGFYSVPNLQTDPTLSL